MLGAHLHSRDYEDEFVTTNEPNRHLQKRAQSEAGYNERKRSKHDKKNRRHTKSTKK